MRLRFQVLHRNDSPALSGLSYLWKSYLHHNAAVIISTSCVAALLSRLDFSCRS